MKSKWMKLAAIAMVVALAGGTFVYAKARHGRHGGGGFLSERMFAHMEARLNLTPEQSQQVRSIFEAQRAKMKEQFQGGRADRDALMKAIFSDNPNQAEIQKQLAALQQQHAQMLQSMVSTGLQVNQVFTPEQRAEFLKAMEEHRQAGERFRERMKQRKAEREGQTPQQ
ncbi:MAG TPA: periplasmic heavy metal sensor [Terriglobales bacterium]|nr:periplasmic heavy metal sensor [Terriglobales bacterium]